MPAAARSTDMHTCPSHGGGPTQSGETTVLIGHQPAARVGDVLVCGGPADVIAQGEPSVLIGNKDAARYGDPTEHGGKLIMGCPSVLIGSMAQAHALMTNAPFCEECEKKRQERLAKREKSTSKTP